MSIMAMTSLPGGYSLFRGIRANKKRRVIFRELSMRVSCSLKADREREKRGYTSSVGKPTYGRNRKPVEHPIARTTDCRVNIMNEHKMAYACYGPEKSTSEEWSYELHYLSELSRCLRRLTFASETWIVKNQS